MSVRTHARPWGAMLAAVLVISAAGTRSSSDPEVPPARTAGVEQRASALACEFATRNPRLDAGRAQRIAESVLRCERDLSLPPDLVAAVIWVESSIRPHARSYMGALGLMQVMPRSYARLDLPGHPAHIELNIEAGCAILADNMRRLGEDDGISAYFWGYEIRSDTYLKRVRRARDEIAPRLQRPPTCS